MTVSLTSETRAPVGARPVRLQLSRKKGFDLQAHSRAVNGLPAVKVSRPGPWGNPWSIRGAREAGYTGTDERIAAWCCDLFREWLSDDLRSIARMLDNGKGDERAAALRARLTDLRGRNLACWCKTGPCHADVLLELANGPVCEALPANESQNEGAADPKLLSGQNKALSILEGRSANGAATGSERPTPTPGGLAEGGR